MRTVIRRFVATVVVIHGLIHLLGAAKGLGWADVSQLAMPVSTIMGAVWLAAAVLLVAAGVLLALRARWWWILGGVAAVVSQAVIATSWSDAKAGTIANVVLLAAVAYGFLSQGPNSFRTLYRSYVGTALGAPAAGSLETGSVVTEADLISLPVSVAGYIRQAGAVGRPRVTNFRARIHGRIRSGVAKPWMTFTGEQVNTYGAEPSRLFIMDATMFGLPVAVLHIFVDRSATMRVKACSLITMVDAAGPEMDQGETVTMFNDLCVLAPAALVDAPVIWQSTGDDHHVRGAFTNGAHTITADLTFNVDHELVDFVSDDRLRSSQDGKTFIPQRWSTPIRDYRTIDSRRCGTTGEGRWQAPEPEGEFTYVEFHLDAITYNAGVADSADGSKHHRSNDSVLT